MTRNRIRAFSLAAMIVFCGLGLVSGALGAGAQGGGPPPPVIKVQFQVVRMTYQSIQVSGLADPRELHTFAYSPQIRDKMEKIFNAGGYQYGDHVVVWYRRGETVALKIKGKPSKPK